MCGDRSRESTSGEEVHQGTRIEEYACIEIEIANVACMECARLHSS